MSAPGLALSLATDVVAALRKCVPEGVDQELEDEAVLHLAHPEQVRAGSGVHLGDDRSELGHLPVPSGRGPARQVGADGALELAVRRGEFSSSKRFSTFHQAT